MDNPDDRKPEPPAADQMDISTESDFTNKPGPSEENPNPTDQGPIISSGSSSDDSSPILKKRKKTDLLSDVESAAKKATESPEKKEQHSLLKKRSSSFMDNPDDRKPEPPVADQMDISTESDLANKPDPSQEKPNPTDQGPIIAAVSSTEDSPLIPKKKMKTDLLSDIESAAKRATESPEKKHQPLLHQSSEPKKEKPQLPLLRLSKSLDGVGSIPGHRKEPEEEQSIPSPRKELELMKKLLDKFNAMTLKIRDNLEILRDTFNEPAVQTYIPRPRPPRGFPLKKAPGENSPGGQFSDTAGDRTHDKFNYIPETLYFELSAFRKPENPEILKQLGHCVEYVKEKCPDIGMNDCYPCFDKECGICSHQFKCSCEEKYFDTLWCAHQHVAKYVGLDRYNKGEALLFIKPSSSNPTADRHLRAYVLGDEKMFEETPSKYKENFKYVQRSGGYRVAEIIKNKEVECSCPESKKCIGCTACLCKWACTCPDYWLYHQVCEHLHLVAMMRDSRRIELFDELPEDYGQNTRFDKEVVSSEVIGMLNQHEKSHLIEEHMDLVEQNGKWLMYAFGDRKFVLDPEDGKPKILPPEKCSVTVEQDKNLCICEKPDQVTLANYCIRCQICSYHYNCTCWDDKIKKKKEGSTEEPPEKPPICPHVHMIAQKNQPEKEKKSREKRLEELLNSYNAIFDSQDFKFEERGPSRKDDDKCKKDSSQEPMDISEEADPSQAATDECDKASSPEAVKDESRDVPLQEPTDE